MVDDPTINESQLLVEPSSFEEVKPITKEELNKFKVFVKNAPPSSDFHSDAKSIMAMIKRIELLEKNASEMRDASVYLCAVSNIDDPNFDIAVEKFQNALTNSNF